MSPISKDDIRETSDFLTGLNEFHWRNSDEMNMIYTYHVFTSYFKYYEFIFSFHRFIICLLTLLWTNILFGYKTQFKVTEQKVDHYTGT